MSFKRAISTLTLTISTLLFVVLAVLPHHHHGGTCCLGIEMAEHMNGAQNPAHTHSHSAEHQQQECSIHPIQWRVRMQLQRLMQCKRLCRGTSAFLIFIITACLWWLYPQRNKRAWWHTVPSLLLQRARGERALRAPPSFI